MESLRFLVTIITFSLLHQCLARPDSLEDGVLLRNLADSYSAPLVASFLHLRIQNTIQIVEDIKNSLENLSASRQKLLVLKGKSLEALDKQLTSLQKTDYFNFHGTERVKYLIEQYILNNEIFPIEFGSEETNFKATPDNLLEQINVTSNDDLIKSTNDLISVYLEDIEEKESNEKYNELQRLTASLTKHKLKPLVNFNYTEPTAKYDHYRNYIMLDNRALQIQFVLRQFKNIIDLFYPQFENLATQSAPASSLEPVTSKVKGSVEAKDMPTSYDTTESLLLA
ncbi:uncharacterized protein LOC107369034 [Tetranychus urticae]|uniref:Prolyl 4-hydroxylase alpha-subunit N-terminal domain-containing protein n=1 Tax=Tetranychus urticae TaxID=32264 RepID=T1L0R4_TETUR|nr:uncharacterized protein LOC107369034 [Tetranychus urticae]